MANLAKNHQEKQVTLLQIKLHLSNKLKKKARLDYITSNISVSGPIFVKLAYDFNLNIYQLPS